MPNAVLSSSDRFPGFFSFSLVSNSFPCQINTSLVTGEHKNLIRALIIIISIQNKLLLQVCDMLSLNNLENADFL